VNREMIVGREGKEEDAFKCFRGGSWPGEKFRYRTVDESHENSDGEEKSQDTCCGAGDGG